MSQQILSANVEQYVDAADVATVKQCIAEIKNTVAMYPIDLYIDDNKMYELRIRDLDNTIIVDELSVDELQVATYSIMEAINAFAAKQQLLNADKPFVDAMAKKEPKDKPFMKDAFGYELRKGMPVLFVKCHRDDRFMYLDTGKFMWACPSGNYGIIEPDNHDNYYKAVLENGIYKRYPRLIWRSSSRIVATMPFGKMPKPIERKEAIEEGHAIDDKLNNKEVEQSNAPKDE